MNTNNNRVEVKRSWWYKSFRSIGMFCYKYWWLVLLLLIAAILFFWYYISKLKQKEQEYCKQYAIAEQSLKRLDSLIENCTACELKDIGYINPPIDTPPNDPAIFPNIDTIANGTKNGVQFEADYILLTYLFTDGKDLDSRTKMLMPDYGKGDEEKYLGWGRILEYWPQNGTGVMYFGSDNLDQGFESVLINLSNFKQQFPNQNYFSIDMRGFWYSEIGRKPVKINATLYQGGTPVKNTTDHVYQIIGYKKAISFNSASKTITLRTSDAKTNGERIAIFDYDLTTNKGKFK